MKIKSLSFTKSANTRKEWLWGVPYFYEEGSPTITGTVETFEPFQDNTDCHSYRARHITFEIDGAKFEADCFFVTGYPAKIIPERKIVSTENTEDATYSYDFECTNLEFIEAK